MTISNFFLELRSAYQAELEDLAQDSEGKDVLRRRLAEKRKELGFLLQMMELSPEMVAVVLHQAFRFPHPAVMNHLVAQDADDLPEWDSIRDSLDIAPWARDMVEQILQQPVGPWFMTIAAALEYLHHRPLSAQERAQLASVEDEEEDLDEVREHRHDDNYTEDHDEDEAAAQAREEAGNDWMVEQGFDRKE